jgi:hypothetical protein
MLVDSIAQKRVKKVALWAAFWTVFHAPAKRKTQIRKLLIKRDFAFCLNGVMIKILPSSSTANSTVGSRPYAADYPQ